MIAAKMISASGKSAGGCPLKSAARKITLPCPIEAIAEIRLRTNRRAAAVTLDGRMLPCSPPFTQQDITDCFLELCRNSVHSFAREIAE